MDEMLREKFSKSLFVNGARKWEDLNTDCLVKIFAKVDIESLIVHFPLVCKSWYKTSLDRQCWKVLDFRYLHLGNNLRPFTIVNGRPHYSGLTPVMRAIMFAANRSCGMASMVIFPQLLFCKDILQYVLEKCADAPLKCLVLPDEILISAVDELKCIPKLINKWTDLESLTLASNYYLKEVLSQIHTHCKKFVSLTVTYMINTEVASIIVAFVPNIKHLVLISSHLLLRREDLTLIMSGCRELELLDVRECSGFEADPGILTMASHIKNFMSVVAEDEVEDEDEDEECYSDYSDSADYADYVAYISD